MNRKGTVRRIITGLLVLVLIAASVAVIMHENATAQIGGAGEKYECPKDVTSLALQESGVTSLDGIGECEALERLDVSNMGLDSFDAVTECKKLSFLDLRGNSVSIEKYEQLRAALPGCEIRWDVPISGVLYPDDAESIDLSSVAEEDYALLRYLPKLTAVDAQNAPLSAGLVELYRSMPDCAFSWTVDVNGEQFGCDTEKLDFNGKKVKDLETFSAQLAYLPKLRKVELCDSGLSNAKMEQLIAAYPDVKFVWKIRMGKWELRTDVTNFSTANLTKIPDPPAEDVRQLRYLTDIISLDLGHNKLPSLEFLSGLTSLRVLILVDCGLKDISPLATLTNLEYVEMFENEIRDLSAISNWTKLKEINLGKNSILDFSPLYECKQLERVWLGGNYSISKTKRKELLENLPDGVELNTYIYRWDSPTERDFNNPNERSWRPIDYTKWGFTYDNPLNSRYDHSQDPPTHSSANIDTTPVDD